MSSAWIVLLAAAGIVPAFFALYQLVFAAITLVLPASKVRTPRRDREPTSRFCVMVPAHNEALLIGHAVDALLRSDYPRGLIDVIVIADNCDDDTATIARDHGARCLERTDPVNRGKSYALSWLIEQLDVDRYDGFAVIDADTVVDQAYFDVMDRRLSRGETAIQSYSGVLNPHENWLTRLAALPAVLKFRMHYPGKMALGLTCPLTGTGMCLSREVVARFGWNAFAVAENWEYWIQITLAGYRATAAADAIVESQAARSLATSADQRRRWQRGRIDTLRWYGRSLLAAAARGRMAALDALIELLRPSYANLMLVSLLYLAACAAAVQWSPDAPGWLAGFAAVVLGAQVAYFMLGLVVMRAPLSTWLALGMVPVYLVWKATLSVPGLRGSADRRWVRTARHGLDRDDDQPPGSGTA